MAKVEETLFMKIATQFDSVGSNAAIENLNRLNDMAMKVTNGLMNNTIGAFADLEEQMIDLTKSIDLTPEALKEMTKEFITMSNATGTSAVDLAAIASAAAKVGVSKENLVGFTRVIEQMSIAFKISAGEASSMGAAIASGFRLDKTEATMVRIGDVINTMGGRFNFTEKTMGAFLARSAGIAKQMGLTLEQTAALGTSLLDTGQSAEIAAGSLKRALLAMTGTGLSKAAKLMGMTKDAFLAMASKDTFGSIQKVIQEIEKIPNAGKRMQTVNKIFGTFGQTIINPMVGNLGLLNRALEESTGKSLKMSDEVAKQMKTWNAQVKRFWEILSNFGKIIGMEIAPSLGGFLKAVNDILSKVQKWMTANAGLVKGLGALVIGFTALAASVAVISKVVAVFLTLKGAAVATAGAFATAKAATATAVAGFSLSAITMKGVFAAASAFFMGWGLTRIIGEVTGLDNAVQGLFETFMDTGATVELGGAAKGRKPTGRGVTPGAPKPHKPGSNAVEAKITVSDEGGLTQSIAEHLKLHVSGLRTCEVNH